MKRSSLLLSAGLALCAICSAGAQAGDETHLEWLYAKTPCLREYREYTLVHPTADQFPVPEGFTRAQCEAARATNDQIWRARVESEEAERRASEANVDRERAKHEGDARRADRELAARIAALRREDAKARAEAAAMAKKPGVRIGMTPAQVLNETSWGKPQSVYRTTTSEGTREQWVYGGRNYLYFTDGRLTAIQN